MLVEASLFKLKNEKFSMSKCMALVYLRFSCTLDLFITDNNVYVLSIAN